MQPVSLSHALSPWMPSVLSLVLYAGAVLVAIGGLLFLTGWLGERKKNPEKKNIEYPSL